MKQIKKAVFPAAGFGTRFLPATKASPKEMLPIVDIPLIDLAVREAKASGIDEIIIITGRGKGAIEDYFDQSYELEKELEKKGKHELIDIVKGIYKDIQVVYVRQKEMKGLGDAVLTAKNIIGDEPFAVLLADDIIFSKEPCLKQMIDFYNERQNSVVAIQEVPFEQVSSYGVVDPDIVDGQAVKIKGTIEKPSQEKAPSNYAIIGRYILTPKIFELLENISVDPNEEIQLTDAISKLLEHEDVFGFLFEGERYDAGNKLGFLKATVVAALNRDDLAKDFKTFLLSVIK